jgi:basic membrane lipoprotein Med (substrate-binding protein (PBP1-ABC) superfamily)
MKIRALVVALVMSVAVITPVQSEELPPKVAVAYDIGFLGDNSYNDAVHEALVQAKKKYRLVEPFVREVPTNGTAVDRLTRMRFLAKSGYTLIIAVGPGYRETVRRVSMEFPEIQFALINDKSLGQMNISNVYYNENDGAYLAGVAAAANSKRRSIGFAGSEPDLFKSFSLGARATIKSIKIVNIPYPDEIEPLRQALKTVDVLYSTWDGDATILSTVLESYSGKVRLIAETPDQYFATLPGAQKVLLATVKKNLTKPIDQLVAAGLQSSAIIDVVDDVNGIYGREYSIKNGGIGITFIATTARTTEAKAATLAIRAGKVSTRP